ncbi:uncharacterized protein LOC122871606 [Siniperca chuatsi]|uniref:uncharacterized protein LOC122871606 n=1 Tax=Siniperca chuatsi TaxID=119488 RepID=UPI001CE17720|nr:uncharacterized protein LOC122871606 [Siniperca chuatsi]
MTAESNRIQTAASDLNQSSPVLGPPNRVGKMTTENNQNRFPSPSQMDPVVNSGKCKNIAWCAQQYPPWTSVFNVWDLYPPSSGLAMNAEEEQFSKCSRDELLSDKDDVPDSELDQISDDDENMSDKDYIPDSESQNDDADDDDTDASIPFMPSQSKAKQVQVNPVLPDVGTSYGSDTSIPVVPSTSKCWPPLEDPNAAETSVSVNSIKDSKEKPEDEAKLHEQKSTHLTMSKENYCYVCGKPQSKISILENTQDTC